MTMDVEDLNFDLFAVQDWYMVSSFYSRYYLVSDVNLGWQKMIETMCVGIAAEQEALEKE